MEGNFLKNFRLNNNLEIPELGFGTYKADLEAIKLALENGVKYFETQSGSAFDSKQFSELDEAEMRKVYLEAYAKNKFIFTFFIR